MSGSKLVTGQSPLGVARSASVCPARILAQPFLAFAVRHFACITRAAAPAASGRIPRPFRVLCALAHIVAVVLYVPPVVEDGTFPSPDPSIVVEVDANAGVGDRRAGPALVRQVAAAPAAPCVRFVGLEDRREQGVRVSVCRLGIIDAVGVFPRFDAALPVHIVQVVVKLEPIDRTVERGVFVVVVVEIVAGNGGGTHLVHPGRISVVGTDIHKARERNDAGNGVRILCCAP